MLETLMRKLQPAAVQPAGALPPRPPIMSGVVKHDEIDAQSLALFDEYAALAKQLGLPVPHKTVERFKAFLIAKDIPVFSLPTVVAYMDEKAKEESGDKAGWLWKPLRRKDHMRDLYFGTAAVSDGRQIVRPASDWYVGPKVRNSGDENHYSDPDTGSYSRTGDIPSPIRTYDKTIPLHAIRRVALIECEFNEPVHFFVCDYAPKPAFKADPFLMAVIANDKLVDGEGRFVIDFWDEPGFGIDKMLK